MATRNKKPNLLDQAAAEFLTPPPAPASQTVGGPAAEVTTPEPAPVAKVSQKAPQSPVEPSEAPEATPAPAASGKSTVDRLAAAQAEVERLQRAAREEAIRVAKFPWQNPQVLQDQNRMGYHFKIDPELYLQIQWLMENRGGIKSIQVFLDRAAKKMAHEMLEEMGAL